MKSFLMTTVAAIVLAISLAGCAIGVGGHIGHDGVGAGGGFEIGHRHHDHR